MAKGTIMRKINIVISICLSAYLAGCSSATDSDTDSAEGAQITRAKFKFTIETLPGQHYFKYLYQIEGCDVVAAGATRVVRNTTVPQRLSYTCETMDFLKRNPLLTLEVYDRIGAPKNCVVTLSTNGQFNGLKIKDGSEEENVTSCTLSHNTR